MKYYHPDFKNYVIDESERSSWWSPEKEKDRLRREYDQNLLKRGPWLSYASLALAVLYVVAVIACVWLGGATREQIFLYILLILCWAGMAVAYYYEYKKAKARAAATGTAH